MTIDWQNAKNKGKIGEQLLLRAISKARPNNDFYSDGDRTIDIKSKTLGFMEVKSEGVGDVIRVEEAKRRSDFPPDYTNKIQPGFFLNGEITRKYMIMPVRLKKGELGGVLKAVEDTAHTGMPTLYVKQFFRSRIMDPSGHVHEKDLVYMIFYAPDLAQILRQSLTAAIDEFAHNHKVRTTGKGTLKHINTAYHGIVDLWHGQKCPHDQKGFEHEPMAKSGTRECRVRVDLEIFTRNLKNAKLTPPTMNLEKALAYMERARDQRMPPVPPPSDCSDTPTSQRSYSLAPTEEEKEISRSI